MEWGVGVSVVCFWFAQVVGEWRFSKVHCDIFVTMDVMMCTASILNLCAISIDRLAHMAHCLGASGHLGVFNCFQVYIIFNTLTM